MTPWRYSPAQLPATIAAAAARADDTELRAEVPARDARGNLGRLAVGHRHLYWAQTGTNVPATTGAAGLALGCLGVLLLPSGAGLAIALVGAALVAGSLSWLLSFRARRGVVTVPLSQVSPALVTGHVWARARGTLYDLQPLGEGGAEAIEAVLRTLAPPASPAAPAGEPPIDDLSPLFLRVAGFIILAAAVVGLATVITPHLFFSETLPAGGDMGSHHYIPQQLEHFLPLRLSGWSDGWYAGFPMLHFYFPLPYLAIVVLQKLVGYGFAFRMVSLAGVVGFPFACYFCLRWMGFEQPVPIFGAAGGFAFVTSETFSILGGNIASTMAGEFPFSISLTLAVFLIGLLWRGTRTGKGLVPAAVVFAALVLSHVVPLMMVVPAGALVLVGTPRRVPRQFGFLLVGIGLGGLLAAVWLLPFLGRITYTAHAVWIREWKSNYLTGGPVCTGGCHQSYVLAVYFGAGILGLGLAAIRLEGGPLVFAGTAVVMALLAANLPQGAVLNTRALPFYYSMVVLGGAYGLGTAVRLLAVDVGRVPAILPALAVILAGAVIIGSSAEMRFIKGWVQYNYSGYEKKDGYREYLDLMSTLRALPPGRILWEYNGDYERFGTTRSLELIPYWTGQPSMEGLLVESSITAPFHFIMQNETSFTGTGAVPGLRYPSFDFSRGLAHAALYDISYFVAYTQNDRTAAHTAGFSPVATSGQFEVYRLPHPGMVSVPTQTPAVAAGRDWYAGGLDWFCFSDLQRLVVFPQGGEGPLLRRLPHLPPPPPQPVDTNNGVNGKSCGRGDHALNLDLVGLPPGPPLPRSTPVVSRSSGGVIEFDTDQVGVPHLVATSWFPTWKVEGAEGPYLVSPSLMLVIPTQHHVVLTEGRRGLDWAGLLLTLLGAALLVAVSLRQRRHGLLFAPPPEPAPPHLDLGPEPVDEDALPALDGRRRLPARAPPLGSGLEDPV